MEVTSIQMRAAQQAPELLQIHTYGALIHQGHLLVVCS